MQGAYRVGDIDKAREMAGKLDPKYVSPEELKKIFGGVRALPPRPRPCTSFPAEPQGGLDADTPPFCARAATRSPLHSTPRSRGAWAAAIEARGELSTPL